MTNLIGKWCQHRSAPNRSGEIVAITFDKGELYLYTRQDNGDLYKVYYSYAQILDRRPDTAGPYR